MKKLINSFISFLIFFIGFSQKELDSDQFYADQTPMEIKLNYSNKSMKKNTLSTRHQLNMLYRRFSNEAGKARFLVEHYIKILDRGASSPQFLRIEVTQGRKSADYRFLKDKYPGHQAINTAIRNPIREGINKNHYTWTKTGSSSYDDEDIVIIEGKGKKGIGGWIRLYIGIDTFSVYKVESRV